MSRSQGGLPQGDGQGLRAGELQSSPSGRVAPLDLSQSATLPRRPEAVQLPTSSLQAGSALLLSLGNSMAKGSSTWMNPVGYSPQKFSIPLKMEQPPVSQPG